MKPRFTMPGAALLLASLLVGCGSKSDDGPTVKVTELAAGTYVVAAGDAANPSAGKYYAGADGSRLLVLNNAAQQATALYRRDGNGSWQAAPPATQDTTLDLLHSSAIGSTAITVAAVAGSYAIRLAPGSVAVFAVSTAGDIVPGTSTCKLSGKVAATPLPQALKLSLSTAGCGDLPAQSEGFLLVDGDYAPAAFRLVTTGAGAPGDLWAYRD